jgi:hypothetical protein
VGDVLAGAHADLKDDGPVHLAPQPRAQPPERQELNRDLHDIIEGRPAVIAALGCQALFAFRRSRIGHFEAP